MKDLVITEIISPQGTICQEQILPNFKNKNIGNIAIQNFEIEMYIDDVLEETNTINQLIEASEETYIQFEKAYYFTENITHETKFIINALESNEYNLNNSDSTIFNTVNTGNGLSESTICDFEDLSFPPQFIFIENPDNDITWEYDNINGNQVFYLNNFNNTSGNKDAFTTTDYNISGIDYFAEALSFEYAYKQKNNNSDTLNLYYSLDCGAHWIPLKSYFGNNFGTNENTAFFPNKIENIEEIILTDFLPFPLFNKIRFKFENISAGGNNLFIDNINLRLVFDINEEIINEIEIFPNPTKDFIYIKTEQNKAFSISFIDVLGNQVMDNITLLNSNKISTKNLTKGLYFLHFQFEGNETSFYKKIIVNH